MSKLEKAYYLNDDVVFLARDLLGKLLCTFINDKLCKGIITETEAYAGVNDKASHAYGGRFTDRTSVMFAEGGRSYIYLCYGIHSLFNIVTSVKGQPHAVLVRAVYPTLGLDVMESRLGRDEKPVKLGKGPGKLSRIMGLSREQNDLSLLGNTVWVEQSGVQISQESISVGPRIGIDYAGEDALLPYRFNCQMDFQAKV